MAVDRTDYKGLADKLWPFLAGRASGGGSAASAGSSGGLAAHELGGSYHTGVLARSQAPWVASDLAAHAALPDAHHAKAHGVLDTANHTFPTGAALDVLGYTAANTPGKVTPLSTSGAASVLLKTDSNGYVQVQRLTAASQLFVGNSSFTTDATHLLYEGPKALWITSAVPVTYVYSPDIYLGDTAGSTTHLRANGLDSDDGDLAYTLGRAKIGHLGYSDYAGFAHRDRASSGNYALLQYTDGNTYLNASSGTQVTHAIGGSTVFQTSADRVNPAASMFKDLGDYNRKWRTGFFAELYAETLVAQDVMATIGGRVMVAPTSKLVADVASGGSTVTLHLEHNSFAVGTYLYMMAAPGGVPQIEAFKITSGPTGSAGDYSYVCNRNLDGTGSNAWVIGDAVVSTGSAAGHGYIDITATQTIHNHFGPTITHYVRTSTGTWNSVAPVVTAGNLRSFVDYTGDEFGNAAGNDLTLTPSTGFKGYTLDRTQGLRLFNTHIEMYTGASKIIDLNQTDGLAFAYGPYAPNQIQWFSGSNETLNIGSYDWSPGSDNVASLIATPKQSGWTARIHLDVNDFSGANQNRFTLLEDAAVFQKEILANKGLMVGQSTVAGSWSYGSALRIDVGTDGIPLLWFTGAHDGAAENPETFATAGSLWKYILVKVGNTLKKMPIYNVS